MKVLKFGGTSVGSKEGRERICGLAMKCQNGCVLVVSALGGVTDLLILLSKQQKNSENYNEVFQKITDRHKEAVEQSIEKNRQEGVWNEINEILEKLRNEKGENTIVSYGEKISSLLMARMMEGAVHLNSLEVVSTFKYFNRHIIDFVRTNLQLKNAFGDKTGKIVVMGGFISADRDNGDVTNLGRGGSDYTAAIVAAAIGAQKLYIYTDVDGFLSADPRIIPNAILLDQLGYIEAMELCNYGAKVLYSPTIFPAFNADIPIVIRNTYGDHPGTTIDKRQNENRIASGVTSMNDTALVSIAGELTGMNYRIFKELSNEGVSLILVARDGRKKITQLALKNAECEKAIRIIEERFGEEIQKNILRVDGVQKNLATVAVVGKGVCNSSQGMAQLLSTLEEHGVEVIASSGGASGSVLAMITPLGALRRAIAILHTALFDKVISELNVYTFGENRVKEKFLEIAQNNKKQLFEKSGVRLNFHNLGAGGVHSVWTENSVVVDCSRGLLEVNDYTKLLESGINIVSVEGVQLSRSFEEYQRIQNTVGEGRLKYSASVCGGLPVIDTLKNLRENSHQIQEVRVAFPRSVNIEDAEKQMTILSRECGFSNSSKGDIMLKNIGVVDKSSNNTQIIGVVCNTGISLEGIEVTDPLNPLYNTLENSHTVLIWTDKYREYPLQLKEFEGGEMGGEMGGDGVEDMECVIAQRVYQDLISLGGVFSITL